MHDLEAMPRGPGLNNKGRKPRLNSKGYLQAHVGNGKYRLVHVLEWERHHGPVPDGMQLHHKDENKTNNHIDNLELTDPLTHKRIHSGCELRDGVWWKPCRDCGLKKPVDRAHWYFAAKGRYPIGRCKPCYVREVGERKRRRAVADA
jgi:hypothetical protein